MRYSGINKRGDDMKNKFIIMIIIVLVISVGLVNLFVTMDGFKYITKDDFGKWYYDKASIETRIDEETGAEIIDVWLKRDLNDDSIACAQDEVLWHIDYVNGRYKASDTVAIDKDGGIIET